MRMKTQLTFLVGKHQQGQDFETGQGHARTIYALFKGKTE